jgi:hypothetical protein
MEEGMKTGKDCSYFPHDSNAKDDPKVMLMMAQLGLEAYGIYWILIEYLRDQPGYSAPISLLDPLSRRYGSSKEKFEAVVKTYNLFENDEVTFWSESLNRRMFPLDEKRLKMRENIGKRWDKRTELQENNTNEIQLYNNSNTKVIQSKVKESKVNKSKEEENIQEFIASLSPSFLSVWQKWIEYKRKIRKPYKTREGMEGKFNELVALSGNNPETAMKIVEQSIRNEWSGLFGLKLTAITTNEDPVERSIRELKEIRDREKLEKSA